MGKFKDLTGQKFGRLTVIEKVDNNIHNKVCWNCICECGNYKIVPANYLISGRTKSCGCFSKEILDSKKLNLLGKRFGKLLVIKQSKKVGSKTYWECICDCGNVTIKRGDQLALDKTHSCGCYQKEIASTHNMSNTRFYNIWRKARDRCTKNNSKDYKHYGGRGISMFENWLIFENFYRDMYNSYLEHSNKYSEKNTTLERIDVNGNYEPDNCIWATQIVQGNNRRNTKLYEYKGYKLPIKMLCEKYNVDCSLVRGRIFRGWELEKALNMPKK